MVTSPVTTEDGAHQAEGSMLDTHRRYPARICCIPLSCGGPTAVTTCLTTRIGTATNQVTTSAHRPTESLPRWVWGWCLRDRRITSSAAISTNSTAKVNSCQRPAQQKQHPPQQGPAGQPELSRDGGQCGRVGHQAPPDGGRSEHSSVQLVSSRRPMETCHRRNFRRRRATMPTASRRPRRRAERRWRALAFVRDHRR